VWEGDWSDLEGETRIVWEFWGRAIGRIAMGRIRDSNRRDRHAV
jgi:hypothetical protein